MSFDADSVLSRAQHLVGEWARRDGALHERGQQRHQHSPPGPPPPRSPREVSPTRLRPATLAVPPLPLRKVGPLLSPFPESDPLAPLNTGHAASPSGQHPRLGVVHHDVVMQSPPQGGRVVGPPGAGLPETGGAVALLRSGALGEWDKPREVVIDASTPREEMDDGFLEQRYRERHGGGGGGLQNPPPILQNQQNHQQNQQKANPPPPPPPAPTPAVLTETMPQFCKVGERVRVAQREVLEFLGRRGGWWDERMVASCGAYATITKVGPVLVEVRAAGDVLWDLPSAALERAEQGGLVVVSPHAEIAVQTMKEKHKSEQRNPHERLPTLHRPPQSLQRQQHIPTHQSVQHTSRHHSIPRQQSMPRPQSLERPAERHPGWSGEDEMLTAIALKALEGGGGEDYGSQGDVRAMHAPPQTPIRVYGVSPQRACGACGAVISTLPGTANSYCMYCGHRIA